MSETTRPNIVRTAIMLAMALVLAFAVSMTAGTSQALAKGKWYFMSNDNLRAKNAIGKKYVTLKIKGKKKHFRLTKKSRFYEGGEGCWDRIGKKTAKKHLGWHNHDWGYCSTYCDISVKVYKGKVQKVYLVLNECY